MKSCAYCGRENEDEATHCRECGTAEFAVTTPASPRAEPRAERTVEAPDPSKALKRLLTIIAWTAGAFLTTSIASWFALVILFVSLFISSDKSDSTPLRTLFTALLAMLPIIVAVIVLIKGLRGRLPGMPQRNAGDQQGTAPSRLGAHSTHILLTDKIGFVPNLRKKDNLYQAASVGVFLVIGVIVGVAVRGWPEGALLGALGGLIAGGSIGGLVLMVLGLRRRS